MCAVGERRLPWFIFERVAGRAAKPPHGAPWRLESPLPTPRRAAAWQSRRTPDVTVFLRSRCDPDLSGGSGSASAGCVPQRGSVARRNQETPMTKKATVLLALLTPGLAMLGACATDSTKSADTAAPTTSSSTTADTGMQSGTSTDTTGTSSSG